MRRIPHLRDVLRRPGDAAVDVFALPESFLGLEADLEQFAARDRSETLGVLNRKIILNAGHDMHWDAVEAVVRIHHCWLAGVSVGNADTMLLELHRSNLRLRLHPCA